MDFLQVPATPDCVGFKVSLKNDKAQLWGQVQHLQVHGAACTCLEHFFEGCAHTAYVLMAMPMQHVCNAHDSPTRLQPLKSDAQLQGSNLHHTQFVRFYRQYALQTAKHCFGT